jgi:8-oxo-dGTP pyrophosphatase MutT (NUDIX family)
MDSSWGNVTLKLNNAAGAIVAFREYANDSVGLWGDSGLYTLIANSSAPISTPTIPVSASSTFAPSASQSVQPSPSASQSQQPTLPSSSTEAAGFPTETVLFVAAIVTAIIVVLALAFKKKYITIETVNEAAHSSQSESAESRTKPRPEEELENYPQAINYAVEKLVALLSAANLPAKEPTVSKPCAIFVEGLYVVDEKILLLKRNVAPFKGYWHVVGGEVARDESLYSALSREYKEETGLDIEIGKVVGSRVEETLDRTKFIIALEITSAKGTIKLNNENSESYWFGQIPLNSVFDYGKYLRKVV